VRRKRRLLWRKERDTEATYLYGKGGQADGLKRALQFTISSHLVELVLQPRPLSCLSNSVAQTLKPFQRIIACRGAARSPNSAYTCSTRRPITKVIRPPCTLCWSSLDLRGSLRPIRLRFRRFDKPSRCSWRLICCSSSGTDLEDLHPGPRPPARPTPHPSCHIDRAIRQVGRGRLTSSS
jgi:hypothetical protein